MNTATRARQPSPSEGAASVRRLLDDTSRAQMPRPYLLDTGPFPIRKAPAPLRLIKPAPLPASAACGYGVCALDPECTSRCRYREADEALRGHYSERHTQRADMPPLRPARTAAERREAVRLRRLVFGGLAAFWLVVGFGVYLVL
jgi:hypothetical protein